MLQGSIWVLDANQLRVARYYGIIEYLPDIQKEALSDRSKSDELIKFLALLQILWLIIQLIARRIRSLPSSQLEVVTVAYAACSAVTYFTLFQGSFRQINNQFGFSRIVEMVSAGPLNLVRAQVRLVAPPGKVYWPLPKPHRHSRLAGAWQALLSDATNLTDTLTKFSGAALTISTIRQKPNWLLICRKPPWSRRGMPRHHT